MIQICKLSLILSIGILPFELFGQNNGFIGKKNFLSLDARIFSPLIYNSVNRDNNTNKYVTKNDQFEPARNLMSTGLNITLGRTLSNKIAFLFQASLLNFKLINQYSGTSYGDPYLKSTFFKCQSLGIMPIIEFAGRDGLLPVGLSHQIGIGFYSNRIKDGDYLMISKDYIEPILYKNSEIDFFNYDKLKIKSQSFMYKFNIRVPLSRRILYNFGIRYNINITEIGFIFSENSGSNLFSPYEAQKMIRNAQFTNLVSLETGFTVAF